MFNVEFAIDSWIYLALGVAMIAALWIWSFKSLSGLGQFRRILALVLRSLVVLALILALANLQLRRKNDRLTVMYLLDQSASIPQVQREAMVDYVVEEVRRHRDDSYRDRASVIVFGRQANIEVAPIDDNLPIVDRLEGTTNMRIDATNMAAALRMAMATFPEDSARRIVIVSDGNENLGDAASLANELARDGVGIDVVPVRLEGGADVAVERVAVPSEIRKGQPFEASVVLNNLKSPTGSPDDNIRGKIKLSRRRASHEEILATPDIELKPGKNIYRFEHLIDEPDFYEYRVEFVADDSAADVIVENNRATGFTHVQGQGHVLLIEDWEHRDGDGEGEFQYLVERLRAMDIQVTVQFSDELFTTLGDLQRYDTVILANVPRASGSDADNITNFSEAQIAMLLKNTHEMGCGLVMLGGDEAYGAGGWSNSELEKAMPVDFQIHNAKVQMVGALAMVMHASELAQGNHWQKVVAREALKTLGPQDYCGVIHWDGNTGKEAWLWGHPQGIQKVSGNRDRMIGILDRMAPGDMPEFDPSLKMAVAGFNALPEKTLRHMIVISDGDPSPPRMSTVADFKRANVKISTVAIGTHGPAGSTILQNLAQATGGKYYRVRDPNALPKIYQKEARRVARPLIVERDVAPVVTATHEILEGIDGLPPIQGFVMTSLKESGLVEVPVRSPFPSDQKNSTLLATWNYGAGRTVAWTTDAGHRWATEWTSWPQYDKFFSQLVRWSMRPTGDTGNFSITTTMQDDKVQLVVDALDKNDEFLNFLDLSGSVVDPLMETQDIELRQTSPGRYIAEFPADRAGSYFLTLNPGGERAALRTGINVPYSPEFRDRETNETFLTSLARLEPTGGEPGVVIDGNLGAENVESLLATDTFRRSLTPAVSINYVWPWLLLIACCVFLADIFVRRVAVSFAWLPPLLASAQRYVTGKEKEVVSDKRMERLRSRKHQVTDEIDRQRAATRFEPEPDRAVNEDVLDEGATLTSDQAKRAPRTARPESAEPEDQDTYTARLLKAKQEARRKSRGDSS